MTASPIIILIDPQMPENIGACARAMANCGLRTLRLVRPRDGWPHEKAVANAVGAFDHMDPVTVHDTTEDAIADCHAVYATTARHHDRIKTVMDGQQAVQAAYSHIRGCARVAFLFGPERTGLVTDDVALASAIVTIPLQTDFKSLNLAQAVLLIGYEWMKAVTDTMPAQLQTGKTDLADHKAIREFMDRLEAALDAGGFFKTPAMKPEGMRNLQAFLTRAQLTEQEIRTAHGILSILRAQ